ncbi:energy-coupling factor transporter transmembrane component T family protein [Halocatena pleomorpha]|uniref:Energy-coupling factor transporter transmembrane protein EcfT n=1 Tax=Halocatena pleomorpha TaxID=1785090 RepID=A0A3P3R7T8_9EURY|nr:energy-coupling factor transporter transmembrane component T [Halocatena pleomorpha]RRJ29497.1 energy-coupling factor transporter transmembrane protein EcfT [Halocatena pleomorpha]
MGRVPTLYHEHDTILHRRDPRAKLFVFALLVAFLYIAPTWQWMAALTGIGLCMALVARLSWKWVAGLWLLQVPNILSITAFAASDQLLAGQLPSLSELGFALNIVFAWAAALFVSVSLFSTMRTNEIADGLRGLGVPEVICFTVEYTFLLIYASLNDIFDIADAMRLKGVEMRRRRPIAFLVGIWRLFVPVVITIVRRANTMMAVLQMRGFAAATRRDREIPSKLDVGDAILVGGGLVLVCGALIARFGVTEWQVVRTVFKAALS